MKILKLKLFQETACYKKPFAFKVAETYPLPPYSTVIGMFHKILKAKPGEYFPMNISIQGNYESIFSNYQTLRMYKGDKVTSMPRNVHLLLNVNLLIHVKADDEIILLGDIVGGSPMTNAIAQISERGMESQTIVFGGMNLAMALTAAIMKDGMETELLKENLINEAKDAIKEFPLASGDEDEDEDDDI